METPKASPTACEASSVPGCSAPNCPICDMPFEYGDIMIGKDGGRKFCYYCAARAADMFETLDCIIGLVSPCPAGWNVAFAPSHCLHRDRDDCTTWITVRRDEYAEPKVGDFITVTVPKVLRIDSKPNPSFQGTPHETTKEDRR